MKTLDAHNAKFNVRKGMEKKLEEVWVSGKLKAHYNKEIALRHEENMSLNNDVCRQ
jgi:hypothetical protein